MNSFPFLPPKAINTTPAAHKPLSMARSAVNNTRPIMQRAAPKDIRRKMQVRLVLLPQTWAPRYRYGGPTMVTRLSPTPSDTDAMVPCKKNTVLNITLTTLGGKIQ